MKRLSLVAAAAVAVGGLVMLGVSSGAEATSTVPTVTAVTPQNGPTGGGTTVVINGTNLFGTTGVTFGGISASFVNHTNTRLVATAPPGSVGAVHVVVTTGNGTSTPTPDDFFNYVTQGTPTIQKLAPQQGSIFGKTKVYISGADFDAPCSVDFGTQASATVTVVSNTSITAVSPSNPSGTVRVSVTCTGGTTPPDTADQYTYVNGVPVVTAVVQDVGLPTGGETIFVYGTKFLAGSSVDFGTTGASSVTRVSSSILRVEAPPNSPGVVDVTVTDHKGTSSLDPQDTYDYTTTVP